MSNNTIDNLNQLDRESFVEALSGIYEESSWVAERTWPDRPFNSVDDLHQSMKQAVEDSRVKKLDLLRVHPDFAGRTEMTNVSKEEQASAGLDHLTPEHYKTFQRLNKNYRSKFDFPFIMAVKNETPDVIRKAMEERIDNSEQEEFQAALSQVHKIARLRLEDKFTPE